MHSHSAHPIRTASRSLLWTAVLAAWLPAQALEVGILRLDREPNRPLRGEILLSDRAPVVAGELRARIAARETFKVAGMEYHPGLADVQLGTRQLPNGRAALTLDRLPADVARLDLLLTISDRATLTIAEYRVDLKSLGTEFPPARAGSTLAAQQRDATTSAPAPTAGPATTQTPAPNAAAAQPAGATKPAPGAAVATQTPTATPKPGPSTAATGPTITPPPAPGGKPAPVSGDAVLVEAAVRAWAAAWSRRDVTAYLASYAPDFVPADPKLNIDTWTTQRRQRLEARQQIDVRVEQLELEPKGKDWVASFVQHYRGDSLRETARKQLLLRRVGERWLIIAERIDR